MMRVKHPTAIVARRNRGILDQTGAFSLSCGGRFARRLGATFGAFEVRCLRTDFGHCRGGTLVSLATTTERTVADGVSANDEKPVVVRQG